MKDMLTYDEIMATEESNVMYEYLKKIQIEDIAKLTADVLKEHSDETKISQANEVAKLLFFMLEEKGIVREGVQQTFVDLLLSSCLTYNIKTITKDNWDEVYSIRKIIYNKSKEYPSIPEQALESICDVIENQLGEKMPIKGSRPNPNTPGELFAMAVAITSRFK